MLHRITEKLRAAGHFLVVIRGKPLIQHIQLRNSPMPLRIVPMHGYGQPFFIYAFFLSTDPLII